MDHINNTHYQLLKNDPTTKIKGMTMKHYFKPTDSPAPRFYCQPKIHKSGVPISPIVSYSGSSLYNLKAVLHGTICIIRFV